MSAALVFDSGVKMEEDPLLRHSKKESAAKGSMQVISSGSKMVSGPHDKSNLVNFPSKLTQR